MSIGIEDDVMALEVEGTVVATARFSLNKHEMKRSARWRC